MFLELFFILSFIASPLIVFLLNIKTTKKSIYWLMGLFWLPIILESFEFVKLHDLFHNIIILFLYILTWYIALEYYKSIKHKIHRILYTWLSIFLHLICVIFLLFNHILSLLDSPLSTSIHNNIYAIETRYWWAWTDVNMVKVQILQSFGILSVVKFSEYYVDNEIRYSYNKMNKNLEIFIKKDNAWAFLKVATVSL